MESFFTAGGGARWPQGGGVLHVYAVPNPATIALAVAYQDALRDLQNLSRQPADFLHMTVQLFERTVTDVDADQLDALTVTLRAGVAAVPAFDLMMGPALASTDSITLDATPDTSWRQLRRAVRAAATAVLGDDAVVDNGRPGRPHLTIGYATATFNFDPYRHALHNVQDPTPGADSRIGRAVMPVEQVLLVAVDQDPAAGHYTWRAPLAVLPLGAAR